METASNAAMLQFLFAMTIRHRHRIASFLQKEIKVIGDFSGKVGPIGENGSKGSRGDKGDKGSTVQVEELQQHLSRRIDGIQGLISLRSFTGIVITFLFWPSCLGQRHFGRLRVKLPPDHPCSTHCGGITLSLLLLNVKLWSWNTNFIFWFFFCSQNYFATVAVLWIRALRSMFWIRILKLLKHSFFAN